MLALLLTALPSAPLHDAAKEGSLTRVKELLGDGADLEAVAEYGRTALHEL